MSKRFLQYLTLTLLFLNILTIIVPIVQGNPQSLIPTIETKSKPLVVNYMKSSDKYGFTTTKSRFERRQILLTLEQYPQFNIYLDRKLSFTIPGLENTYIGRDCNSMIPQGICSFGDYFLTSSYDAKSECGSVIYVISKDANHTLKCVIELPLKIHAGGITFDGSNIWICGDDEATADSRTGIMYSIASEYITSIIDDNTGFGTLGVDALSKYKISNSASFCTFFRNRLWVGTFTNSSLQESTFGCIMSYDTNSKKHLNGEVFLNFESFILLPNRAQGICFFEKNSETYMALSRSFARNENLGKSSFISEIRLYKPTFDINNSAKMTKKGNAFSVITTPPMIEELCFDSASDRIYAIFESGAAKYSTESKSALHRCKYVFDKIAALDISQLTE